MHALNDCLYTARDTDGPLPRGLPRIVFPRHHQDSVASAPGPSTVNPSPVHLVPLGLLSANLSAKPFPPTAAAAAAAAAATRLPFTGPDHYPQARVLCGERLVQRQSQKGIAGWQLILQRLPLGACI